MTDLILAGTVDSGDMSPVHRGPVASRRQPGPATLCALPELPLRAVTCPEPEARGSVGRANAPGRKDGCRAPLLWVVAAALSGCGGLVIGRPMDTEAPASATGKSYELRYRREKGSSDRYQATYRMRIRNSYQVDDDFSGELVYFHTGKTQGAEAFDRVVIRLSENKRKFLEVSPNGKVERKSLSRGVRQPIITPNFGAERNTRGVQYIPFDSLGRIAQRRETPFHYVVYDSLCYLFPVFPREKVKLGDRWNCETPAIVSQTFSNNRFLLRTSFHFSDLRGLLLPTGATPLCAVIEYSYYGLLDTDNPVDADKLPAKAPGFLWRRYAVEGQGLAYFDVERGKVLWKRDKYRVIIETKTLSPKRKGKGKRAAERKDAEPEIKQEHSLNTMEFAARILSGDERATDRPSRIR